ncbi:hypothetical protein [Desulfovibrio sp. ZJ200]|uniref:hypothetical protein n=1 Tax=Desulfovibrio sp. ZJ200 TaxID=2709792 RepID=UPI00197CCAC1|nr:hypothetical protein [Desulfovibrio sp. ZJ200]
MVITHNRKRLTAMSGNAGISAHRQRQSERAASFSKCMQARLQRRFPRFSRILLCRAFVPREARDGFSHA